MKTSNFALVTDRTGGVVTSVIISSNNRCGRQISLTQKFACCGNALRKPLRNCERVTFKEHPFTHVDQLRICTRPVTLYAPDMVKTGVTFMQGQDRVWWVPLSSRPHPTPHLPSLVGIHPPSLAIVSRWAVISCLFRLAIVKSRKLGEALLKFFLGRRLAISDQSLSIYASQMRQNFFSRVPDLFTLGPIVMANVKTLSCSSTSHKHLKNRGHRPVPMGLNNCRMRAARRERIFPMFRPKRSVLWAL